MSEHYLINFLMILICGRTSFFPSLSLQMETGFSPGQRIVASNSGTQEPGTPNSCCKVTRTPSFLLHPAPAVAALLLVLVICALESGATSHILERRIKRGLILGIPQDRRISAWRMELGA